LTSTHALLLICPPPLRSTLFPYTTLFRSFLAVHELIVREKNTLADPGAARNALDGLYERIETSRKATSEEERRKNIDTIKGLLRDRKSTRLNSSHVKISYAVFCLKKKNFK